MAMPHMQKIPSDLQNQMNSIVLDLKQSTQFVITAINQISMTIQNSPF